MSRGRLSGRRFPLAVRGLVTLAVVAIACTSAAVRLSAQARPFGWKVTGTNGAMYLVGSVHLLTKDFYPLAPALEKAYTDSNLLVEEVDMTDMLGPASQLAMLTRGMQSSSIPLERVLAPSTMTLLTKKSDELGLPLDALKQFKPWMIAVTLEAMAWQKAGFDQDLGLDKHFFDQAQADNKPVQGLETVDYQLSRFDEMPMDLQDRFLAETLKDADSEQANMAKLIDAWHKGDARTVEGFVLKGIKQEPQLYQRLLVDRNRNWMPKLDALLTRQGRALVVVGAAHLVGPDGLLAMLTAKGYRIEQLQ